MKFKITITKEVIDKSLMCGVSDNDKPVTESCAFAVAYNELVPVIACLPNFEFTGSNGKVISEIEATEEQRWFMYEFDIMAKVNPQHRYTLVGQSFDVEIPDEVIEYWHGDAVTAAQKLIDNPIMQLA